MLLHVQNVSVIFRRLFFPTQRQHVWLLTITKVLEIEDHRLDRVIIYTVGSLNVLLRSKLVTFFSLAYFLLMIRLLLLHHTADRYIVVYTAMQSFDSCSLF